MNRSTTLKTVAVGIALLIASVAQAQWTTGEIRRLDPANQRLTIKHGEIKSLDMPPMTMVFYVKDTTLLEGLQVNDIVEFQAIAEGARYFISELRKPSP